MDPTQPNPLLSLVIAVVLAVFGVLTAFNLFPLSEGQKTAILVLTTALFAGGAYLYAWFRQQGWIKAQQHLREMKMLEIQAASLEKTL